MDLLRTFDSTAIAFACLLLLPVLWADHRVWARPLRALVAAAMCACAGWAAAGGFVEPAHAAIDALAVVLATAFLWPRGHAGGARSQVLVVAARRSGGFAAPGRAPRARPAPSAWTTVLVGVAAVALGVATWQLAAGVAGPAGDTGTKGAERGAQLAAADRAIARPARYTGRARHAGGGSGPYREPPGPSRDMRYCLALTTPYAIAACSTRGW